MPAFFNAARDPWISVQLDGDLAKLSLKDTLKNAHRIEALNGEQMRQNHAILRFLTGCVYALLNDAVKDRLPENATDEQKLQMYREIFAEWAKSGKLDEELIDRYFDARSDKFELFDPEQGRPFLQMPDLKNNPFYSVMAIKALKGTVCESNNSVAVFAEEPSSQFSKIEPDEMLRWMIFFGFDGHCATKFGRPKNVFDDERTESIMESKKDNAYSPGFAGQGVQYWFEGDTLFDSLIQNTIVLSDQIPLDFLESEAVWDKELAYDSFSGDGLTGGALLYTIPRDWMRIQRSAKNKITGLEIYGYNRLTAANTDDPHQETYFVESKEDSDQLERRARRLMEERLLLERSWNGLSTCFFEEGIVRPGFEHLQNLRKIGGLSDSTTCVEFQQLYKSSSCGAYGTYYTNTFQVPEYLIENDADRIADFQEITDLTREADGLLSKYSYGQKKVRNLCLYTDPVEDALKQLSEQFRIANLYGQKPIKKDWIRQLAKQIDAVPEQFLTQNTAALMDADTHSAFAGASVLLRQRFNDLIQPKGEPNAKK